MGEALVEVRDVALAGALHGVRLEVQRGEALALLGPHGAGKTAFLACLVGLATPERGEVRVLGLDPVREGRAVRGKVGFAPAHGLGLRPRLTARQQLLHTGAVHGLERVRAMDRADALLREWGLEGEAHARIAGFDRGARQQLQLACALMPDPDLLLLDEPTLGLEPNAARRVHGALRDLSRRGRTLLVATHKPAEADDLCQRVVVLRGGKVLADDTPTGLRRAARDLAFVEIRGTGLTDAHAAALRALEGVEAVAFEDGEALQVLRAQGRDGHVLAPRLLAALEGARVIDLRIREPTLEDAYLRVVGA
ncbi:MAG TPA: ABC transporter ATP-binding protein [Candidatus Thermoplasmatota archaeon]|jgi:ABC-2 type transport system ATP-binding protein|nr:ABC transporter ATP-binding protein [Candidatus Thermoplasmatota archaeon]